LESLKPSNITKVEYNQIDPLLEKKISLITEDLSPSYTDRLYSIRWDNTRSVADFILSLKTEINLSVFHVKNNIVVLTLLSRFHKNVKSFKEMTREDVLSFLDGVRKPESMDPLHKWIGTYNEYRTLLVKFFKWVYYPDIESTRRQKPSIVENIPQLK